MTDAPTVTDPPPGAPGSGVPGSGAPGSGDPRPPLRAPLRRSREQKMISGVCGGLGRFCDVDPVIFRVVLSVLAVTGGLGLIVYGFCWLLVPLQGEEENEGRRLLSGRVEGPALTAVLCALVGCGLFLSMLNNGSVIFFSIMLTIAAAGAGTWSRHRHQAESGGVVDPATAQAVADAPPETKAPPPAWGNPSWWRDPIVKDGTTGPVGADTGYLWGPDDGSDGVSYAGGAAGRGAAFRRLRRAPGASGASGGTSIGGWTFLLALAAAVAGAGASWGSRPLGTSLEIGFACALGVFGLGIAVSSRYGRTGSGTIVLAVVTAALLAAAAWLPKSVTTDWSRRTWAPTSTAAVRGSYELGGGVGELKLDRMSLKKGQTVTTHAEVGAGKLAVTVPKDTRLELTIHVGFGDIRLPGERGDDIDIQPSRDRTVTVPPADGRAAKGTLRLDLEIGLGNVEVSRS
ncbi:integral membrane protein [Streptomyces bingchenggensis BCW-1]|uniref:Integral membrane protein n=2 Tax=Streptomyces TaxID=1883 RepID=D7C105_STRBB|nr:MULTISPECIES: PspC domain-containing protein [Streptomyces]ADI07906.1 integral membrane protein [Streptomyces bingchenggensis BCW-1]